MRSGYFDHLLPDPAGPNAGFAVWDGADADISEYSLRIRKNSVQSPLRTYLGDPVLPVASPRLDLGFGDTFYSLEFPFDEPSVQGFVLGTAVEHLPDPFEHDPNHGHPCLQGP